MASREAVFVMSTIQVLKREPRLTPSFTVHCPYGLGQVTSLSLICDQSLKTPSSGQLLYSYSLASPPNSLVRGIGRGLTGRIHSPGLCSDIPQYSGSTDHSPRGAERSKGQCSTTSGRRGQLPPSPPPPQCRDFQPLRLC